MVLARPSTVYEKVSGVTYSTGTEALLLAAWVQAALPAFVASIGRGTLPRSGSTKRLSKGLCAFQRLISVVQTKN
jgi:hypothetical protein